MAQNYLGSYTLSGEPPHKYEEVNRLMRLFGGKKSLKITTLFKFETSAQRIDELIQTFNHEFPSGSICIEPTKTNPRVY